jgi:hypothetical protein
LARRPRPVDEAVLAKDGQREDPAAFLLRVNALIA